MTNVTELKAHLSRNPAFTAAYNALGPLPTAAPQQSGNTITLQRALAGGATPASLRAVADWNERRVSSARHQAQAMALQVVADGVERGQMQMGRAA